MDYIVEVDLKEREVTYQPHRVESLTDCGRALSLKLLKEKVPKDAGYLEPDNAIIITPGLLSGTHTPSTGRFGVAAKQTRGGIRSINLAGPFANKLASLGIAALVIRGNSDSTSALSIDESGATLVQKPELEYSQATSVIDTLRREFGYNADVVGIGPAGEHIMPLSSIYSTFPPGTPKYFCVRGGMGDIMGKKKLKAVTVSATKEFSAKISDRSRFTRSTKALTSLMLDHPICGKALPSYGSITLMRMLKDGGRFDDFGSSGSIDEEHPEESKSSRETEKINRACSVNCPIGCLNRQKTGRGSLFNSPFDSEAVAASKNLFKIDDHEFVINLNKKCFELGLDGIEFLFSSAMVFKIEGERDYVAGLTRLLNEVKEATLLGRVVGSTSKGVYDLYSDYPELKSMVTKAATTEQSKFTIKMPNRVKGLEHLTDLEYLYSYILGAQNLGMCLFTTFAVLDEPAGLNLLAEALSAKSGKEFSDFDIIQSGYDSMIKERNYDWDVMKAGIPVNIPEFVKVLYRYFGRENNG